jgi:hypothetical protein
MILTITPATNRLLSETASSLFDVAGFYSIQVWTHARMWPFTDIGFFGILIVPMALNVNAR